MFIAIIGTRFSGKSTIEDYLVDIKGFTPIRLVECNHEGHIHVEESDASEPEASDASSTVNVEISALVHSSMKRELADNRSFLSMGSGAGIESPLHEDMDSKKLQQTLYFSSTSHMLDHVTRDWRSNFVTTDLDTRDLVDHFVKRPFFMLVSVDAPLFGRFRRSGSSDLETFVRDHDRILFGEHSRDSTKASQSLKDLNLLANVNIVNSFASLASLYSHLDSLNLTNPDRLRPSWDTYFMGLASQAARRSNCMKRRVGAILVRNHRILSTGYNGTPRGLPNCNEGGCMHCNGTSPAGLASECLCLHAEENALLEAGRDRVGDGAVLYCNTCPCLKCTVKIIQIGVREVVYNLTYKMDDDSAKLFKQTGVALRRHALPP